ncbi:hypothetical protein M9Y10_039812 [Tritrichomonas musculus]|uniref:Uncharacterized protein n=1 Tax=Tritrichomonas musculus TaxID=1915356 RepID=A0ABR2GSF8_9EUKA
MNQVSSGKHALFWMIKTKLIRIYGKEPNIFELKRLAENIQIIYQIPLKRDVKRNKDSIISWMCDHWNIIQNHFPSISNNNNFNPYEVIQKTNFSLEKKQKLTTQYMLQDKLVEVENYLKIIFNRPRIKMSDLLLISYEICKQTKLKLKRNEKRDKILNLAWFWLNWNVIFPLISTNSIKVDFETIDKGHAKENKIIDGSFDDQNMLFFHFNSQDFEDDLYQDFNIY